MASGFGKWFDEQQKEEAGDDGQSPWSQLFSGQEKKTDSDIESQGFLDSATNWMDSFKNSTMESVGLSQSQEAEPPLMMGLSYQTRFKGFVLTLFFAAFFFFMAFTVGLPLVVIRPSKFALCFTMGSLLFMASFGLLKGPLEHVKSMITPDQLPFTIVYMGSMGLTLYASLISRSYILVVIASSIQIGTLCYYFLSFIPGGTTGAKVFITMFMRSARMIGGIMFTFFKGCLKMVSS
jgi:hypothetical protein